jgi:organic anion transporter 5A
LELLIKAFKEGDMEGDFDCWMVLLLDGWMVGLLDGWIVGWLNCWIVGLLLMVELF